MKLVTTTGLITIPDSKVVEKLPDTIRYKNRFTVNSASSNAVYLISYDAATNAGYWTCSCPGNIRHGKCKHLNSLGLLTRYDITIKRIKQ